MSKMLAVQEFRDKLQKMEGQFELVLPKEIRPERFGRVVLTAVMKLPELLECTRESLYQAAMESATDGLIPDGREAVILPYFTKGKKVAKYSPMVAGLRKLARNAGITSWDVEVVHEKDQFEDVRGDFPKIWHRPDLSEDPGPVVAAYSIAQFASDESLSRKVMSVHEINKVRGRSQAYLAWEQGKIKTTTWVTDYDEMCCKTVAKRHAKSLPSSVALQAALDRDSDEPPFEEKRAYNKRIGNGEVDESIMIEEGATDGRLLDGPEHQDSV